MCPVVKAELKRYSKREQYFISVNSCSIFFTTHNIKGPQAISYSELVSGGIHVTEDTKSIPSIIINITQLRRLLQTTSQEKCLWEPRWERELWRGKSLSISVPLLRTSYYSQCIYWICRMSQHKAKCQDTACQTERHQELMEHLKLAHAVEGFVGCYNPFWKRHFPFGPSRHDLQTDEVGTSSNTTEMRLTNNL